MANASGICATENLTCATNPGLNIGQSGNQNQSGDPTGSRLPFDSWSILLSSTKTGRFQGLCHI